MENQSNPADTQGEEQHTHIYIITQIGSEEELDTCNDVENQQIYENFANNQNHKRKSDNRKGKITD